MPSPPWFCQVTMGFARILNLWRRFHSVCESMHANTFLSHEILIAKSRSEFRRILKHNPRISQLIFQTRWCFLQRVENTPLGHRGPQIPLLFQNPRLRTEKLQLWSIFCLFVCFIDSITKGRNSLTLWTVNTFGPLMSNLLVPSSEGKFREQVLYPNCN